MNQSTRQLAATLEKEGRQVLAVSARIRDLADSERILKEFPQGAVNQARDAQEKLTNLESRLRQLSEVSENKCTEIKERQTALDSLNEKLLNVREEFKNLD